MKAILLILCFALAGAVSCGGEKASLTMGPAPDAPPLAKGAGDPATMSRAVVRITLTDGGTPVEGATVAFSRSVSGRAPDYAWEGTTDAEGKATIEITAATSTGCWMT